jgi:hypothetical protein
MAESSAPGGQRPWHQALAYAITGRRRPELGEQAAPELGRLGRALADPVGASDLVDHIRQTLDAGDPWPHPVPADLMTGLGYAQFSAALAQLRSELGLSNAGGTAPRVGTSQPLSAAERRLLDEVPPHHGS